MVVFLLWNVRWKLIDTCLNAQEQYVRMIQYYLGWFQSAKFALWNCFGKNKRAGMQNDASIFLFLLLIFLRYVILNVVWYEINKRKEEKAWIKWWKRIKLHNKMF